MTGSVLVLGVYHQTLAVVRSLSRAGYRVVLGGAGPRSHIDYSRGVAERWQHPPLGSPELAAALCAFLDRRPDIGHVFPVGEESCAALCDVPGLGQRAARLVMVPCELFGACRDKVRANELASRAGIRVPATRLVRSVNELQSAARAIGFPLICKPLTAETRIFGRKAYILEHEDQLDARFTAWPQEHASLLVQAYIRGPVEACDFVARDGVLLGYFEAHRLRTDTLDGTGFGVDFQSVPVSPDVLAACRGFLQATRYSGPGLMQLIRSDVDGELYFLENNPRLAAGIAQAIHCGQDFVVMALRAADDTPLSPYDPERDGYVAFQRTYWLQRDLEGLMSRRRGLTWREARDALRAMTRSWLAADAHMVWDWRDPLPSLVILGRLLRRMLPGPGG